MGARDKFRSDGLGGLRVAQVRDVSQRATHADPHAGKVRYAGAWLTKRECEHVRLWEMRHPGVRPYVWRDADGRVQVSRGMREYVPAEAPVRGAQHAHPSREHMPAPVPTGDVLASQVRSRPVHAWTNAELLARFDQLASANDDRALIVRGAIEQVLFERGLRIVFSRGGYKLRPA